MPAFAAEGKNGVSPSRKIESVILYTVDADGNLEYNVVYEAAVTAETVVKDKTFRGIIEAVEHQDSLFALALQFHPERDALGDSRTDADGNPIDINQYQCNALLGALVKYAGIYESRQNSVLSKLF